MADASDLGSAMPNDGLGGWVADAAAVRATSAVTTCMVGVWPPLLGSLSKMQAARSSSKNV